LTNFAHCLKIEIDEKIKEKKYEYFFVKLLELLNMISEKQPRI